MITQMNTTYRQKDCIELCFADNLFKKCQCHEGSWKDFFPQGNICKTDYEQHCLSLYNEEFFSIENIRELCDCPLECVSITYSMSTSFSNYPSKEYADYLSNQSSISKLFNNRTQIDSELIKSSLLSVSVYYDELKYTQISELKKVELEDLIAGIGGDLMISFIVKKQIKLIYLIKELWDCFLASLFWVLLSFLTFLFNWCYQFARNLKN